MCLPPAGCWCASASHGVWGDHPPSGSSLPCSAYSRSELVVTGLHQKPVGGIDYVLKGEAGNGAPAVRAGRSSDLAGGFTGGVLRVRLGQHAQALGDGASIECPRIFPRLSPQFATVVVTSGWYEDDDDRGEELWYTGACGRRMQPLTGACGRWPCSCQGPRLRWASQAGCAGRACMPSPMHAVPPAYAARPCILRCALLRCRRGRQRPAGHAQAVQGPEAGKGQPRAAGQHSGRSQAQQPGVPGAASCMI